MYFDPTQCGARIRDLRISHGLSLSQLASQIHITSQHLSRIEHGRKGFSADLLVEISLYFNVSLDYLMLGRRHSLQNVSEKIDQAISELLLIKTQL